MVVEYTVNSAKDVDNKVTWTKKLVISNMIFLFIAVFCIHAAFLTLEILQSSINDTIGIYSLVLLNCSKILGSLLGPLVVYKFTPKWTVLLSGVAAGVFVLANFIPTYYVLIPGAVLIGLSQGPLVISFSVFSTAMAIEYAALTGRKDDRLLNKFHAYIVAAIPLAIIAGNAASSSILGFGVKSHSNSTVGNSSSEFIDKINDSDTALSNLTVDTGNNMTCGTGYCPVNEVTNNGGESISGTQVFYILLALLALSSLISVLASATGLTNLTQDQYRFKTEEGSVSLKTHLKRQLKTFCDWRFLPLLPMVAHISLCLTFTVGMVPKAYITCSLGVQMIGYIAMARGLADFITAVALGVFGHLCHRNVLLIIGHLLILCVEILLLVVWEHLVSEEAITAVLMIISVMTGSALSISISQFLAYLGAVFTEKKTEAFSFYTVILSMSAALGFTADLYLCATTLLFMYMGVSLLAGVSFVLFNIYYDRKNFKVNII